MTKNAEGYTEIIVPEDEPANGESIKERRIIIDTDRMDEVLERLYRAYVLSEFPYNLNSTRVPQDERHMPETLVRGTVDHAMFLFTVCYYMRGGIKSNDAVIRLSDMYDSNPDLFVANKARDMDSEEIAKILKDNGLGFQATVSKLWVENAQRMDELWDGDPRNIFEGVNTYEECLARVQNDLKGGGFIGFQEKMVSMIMYYLMDEGLIDYFDHPLPVDIHVLRVSVATEIVKFVGYDEAENVLSDELLAILRKAYKDYAVDKGITMLRLCDAVWLLSSSICGIQPGNITLEPQGRKNRNGRATELVPLNIDLNDEKQRQDYKRSCRDCPIQNLCKWNVPGKIYYVQGRLARAGIRQTYPEPSQIELFEALALQDVFIAPAKVGRLKQDEVHDDESLVRQEILF